METKDNLSDFERGIVVFQKVLIFWDFHTQPSLWFTENVSREKYPVSGSSLGDVDAGGQRRMSRLDQDDRNVPGATPVS